MVDGEIENTLSSDTLQTNFISESENRTHRV